MRLEVKASQELFPTVHFILFALQGDFFRKIGPPKDETLSSQDQLTLRAKALQEARQMHKLPAKVRKGPLVENPLLFPSEKKSIKTDYAPDGDSPMTIEIDSTGGTTYHEQANASPKSVNQNFISGKITLRNPTDQDITVRSVQAHVKEAGGQFVDASCAFVPDYSTRQAVYVGFYKGSFMKWGVRHPEVEWIKEGHEFTIKARDKMEVVVRVIWTLDNCKAYNGMPLNMRIHSQMVDLVTTRATFVQESGQKVSVCWDCTNEVLEDRSFTNYEELVSMPGERDPQIPLWRERRLRGIGDDHQCHIWLHLDDPDSLLRYYIVVTSPKNDPTYWMIRAGQTSDKFPSNHHIIRPKDLERIAFDAKHTHKSTSSSPTRTVVVDKSSSWSYASKICHVRVFVDLDRQVVYGLQAEIELPQSKGGGDKATTVYSDTMYFDWDMFRDEST